MKKDIRKSFIAVLTVLTVLVPLSKAQSLWTEFELPVLNGWSGPTFSHLSSGRLIYAENGILYRQDSWQSTNFSVFDNADEVEFDPSFIAAHSSSGQAVMGSGGSDGASDILKIDQPYESNSTFSTGIGSVLNYDGVFRDAESLFVIGSSFTSHSSLSHMAMDGSFNDVLIEDISQFASGIAISPDGDLFTGTDTGVVYRFGKDLLDEVIAQGTKLTIESEGVELFADFEHSIGSLAVDSSGGLWAAGWDVDPVGISYFSDGTYHHFLPGRENNNYTLGTFTHEDEEYLAYINNAEWSAGSELTYGYAPVSAIPEPSTAITLLFGVTALWLRRRKIGGRQCS